MTRLALLISLLICLTSPAYTQKKTTSSLCTRDNALDTAKQQILLTRTFDNPVQRIAVLVRAADLLWPHDQEKSLAAFMEAFDLAVQNFKEKGDQIERTSSSKNSAIIQLPDQRFKVISVLAKRDPARARKLSEQMLQDDARDVTDKPDDQSRRLIADKLLRMAFDLAVTDPPTAINFARQSFRYPATLQLPIFFFQLARFNQQLADQFYVDALNVYRAAPMDQFLYLSAYPFANQRDAGEMPGYTLYAIPEGFKPNHALQRQFVQALLARIEGGMETPVQEVPNSRYSDHAQMWLALNRLEKQVQSDLPEFADAVARSKDKLFALLTPNVQRTVNRVIDTDNEPKKSFDEQVEAAEKLTDVGRRDQGLTFAVTGSSKDQPVDKVLSVIDKISESGIRDSLLNWFYYFRSQELIKQKNFSEARKFASKVVELDQRAYLFTRIAEESLKVAEDQTEAREMLNEVADTISKAPKTIVAARALLALAYLYAKVDMNRGVEELGNAVRTINAIDSPDFSRQFVMMKIEGKTFGSYASYSTPGFNPENAFREMGKLDFDGSLTQATNFSDKSLRALTTLAVIEPCFETIRAPKTRKP
jgi:tetratricopeptide (TPR) repeat protein